MIKVGWGMLVCGALAMAPDQVTVPLSNPSQPATVKAHVLTGSITVTGGGKAGQVVVESSGGSSRRDRRDDAPAGMRRIDMGGAGLDITEDHNVVTIGLSRNFGSGNLTIQVPTNTSVQLRTTSGRDIEVTGISGEVDVQNMNGAIVLKDISGNILASSSNGSITANLDKIAEGKPMSFTTMNGKVDVTLPSSTKAKLRMRTGNGAIYSDFDVKLDPDANKPTMTPTVPGEDLKHWKTDHTMYGTINGGGPEFRFETMNGTILIHKK